MEWRIGEENEEACLEEVLRRADKVRVLKPGGTMEESCGFCRR